MTKDEAKQVLVEDFSYETYFFDESGVYGRDLYIHPEAKVKFFDRFTQGKTSDKEEDAFKTINQNNYTQEG